MGDKIDIKKIQSVSLGMIRIDLFNETQNKDIVTFCTKEKVYKLLEEAEQEVSEEKDDLIRRSDVVKALEECNLDKELFEKDVFEKINDIPTAYNVEAVVAELEKVKHNNPMVTSNYILRKDAIDIVRKGGVE